MDLFLHGGGTKTILKLIGESLFKKFYLSYTEKCPSKHAAICPSKYELCVLPSMKLELRNKSSPLQLKSDHIT